MRIALFAAAVAVAVALPGCGDTPRATVRGKVTYQGKPLPDMLVVFLAKDNKTHSVPLKPDGTYEVTGVALGPVRVSVQQSGPRPTVKADPDLTRPAAKAAKASVADEKASFRPPDPEPGTGKAAGVRLPYRYADPESSGLSFDLKDPDQEWSVDLQ